MSKKEELLRLFVGEEVRVKVVLPRLETDRRALYVTGFLCEDKGHYTIDPRQHHVIKLTPFTAQYVTGCVLTGSQLLISLMEQEGGKGVWLA